MPIEYHDKFAVYYVRYAYISGERAAELVAHSYPQSCAAVVAQRVAKRCIFSARAHRKGVE